MRFESVIDGVVEQGLCIGCGLCAGLLPRELRVRVNAFGAYEPERVSGGPVGSWGKTSLDVCPFAEHEENEDSIAARRFGQQRGIEHRPEPGYYLGCFVGYVTDEEDRLASTSGGLLTWLVRDLLRSGEVDGAVCVGLSNRSDRLFDYRIVRSPDEVDGCKKSRYYPIEVSSVISQIKETQERFVFVGLPCFVKGMHLAMDTDDLLRDRIAYCIGLFCGHLKTRQYAWYLARSCGIHEKDIVSVDFRAKLPDRKASDYGVEVTADVGGERVVRTKPMREIYARNWGLNLLMHDACDCCDDVMAETADVAVGDAWLPEYVTDPKGTSIVVCRDAGMLARLEAGIERGELHLERLAADRVIQSQQGCLRHRRQGLAYRLHLARRRGQYRPTKRVAPDARPLPLFNRLVQRVRMRIKRASREAFRMQQPCDGLAVFVRGVRPWVRLHDALYWGRRIPGRIRRGLLSVLRPDRSGGATGETK